MQMREQIRIHSASRCRFHCRRVQRRRGSTLLRKQALLHMLYERCAVQVQLVLRDSVRSCERRECRGHINAHHQAAHRRIRENVLGVDGAVRRPCHVSTCIDDRAADAPLLHGKTCHQSFRLLARFRRRLSLLSFLKRPFPLILHLQSLLDFLALQLAQRLAERNLQRQRRGCCCHASIKITTTVRWSSVGLRWWGWRYMTISRRCEAAEPLLTLWRQSK
mmetsp:Transcript_12956/g.34445  ORF Transcript_12956/g.34445 Transcript_12956/m.34445 type:complete len:220 (+) Transcript_12956:1847-2506(+)